MRAKDVIPLAELSGADQPFRPEPTAYHSAALDMLVRRLRALKRPQVLDLGPPSGANVEFLAGLSCKVYIEDVYGSLRAEPHRAPAQTGLSPCTAYGLLAYPPQTRFDAVLAWDLFNYLPAGLLRDLAAHLSRYCIAGTPLYALIAARSEIPAEPMRFRVRDERHVTYEPASAATRPSPGHSPRELETLIPGFGVSRSVLLRNGMQEHVFVRT